MEAVFGAARTGVQNVYKIHPDGTGLRRLTRARSGGYLSSTFYDLIVFAILIVVLIVRPTGLLGKAEIKKI